MIYDVLMQLVRADKSGKGVYMYDIAQSTLELRHFRVHLRGRGEGGLADYYC